MTTASERPFGLDVLRLPMPGQSLVEPDVIEVADPGSAAEPTLSAPVARVAADGSDRAFHRWMIGHHVTFGVWRMLADVLAGSGGTGSLSEADTARAAWWYDCYSALLLYAGSCTPEVYARSIRPRMAVKHPAFSGLWARDYEWVAHLLGRLNPPRDGVLKRALKRNRLVHMTVAQMLVPEGASLFKGHGGRAGNGVTDAERALFDEFFLVSRGAVTQSDFTAAMLSRLVAIRDDLVANPIDLRAEVLDMLPTGLPDMIDKLIVVVGETSTGVVGPRTHLDVDEVGIPLRRRTSLVREPMQAATP
ncbi:hypothetical protein [Lentzea aerocolonigenes]|uniref:hypothetical protein n=1 Tax=Lentzea aerocolonigenes TaxID=68170 RepID=UPI00069616D4|nr:hypothetical protein [Lentzea aerocolonigenes]